MKRYAALLAALSFLDRRSQRLAHETLQAVPRFSTYGDPQRPPVVLVPGLDGCASFYAEALPALAAEFYVVVYHIPLANAGNAADYSFSYLASGLARALDAAGIERAAIVGESFGGVVAMHAALEHPDRVERLVLLSSLAKTELTPSVALKKTFALPVVRLLGAAFPCVAQLLFAVVHSYDVVEASEPHWVRSFFVKEAAFAHHASVMRRLDLVIPLDITGRVPNITHPARLVYGADDTFTGATTAALLALLPNADAVPLPGGHLPHLTSPRAFAAAVADFVRPADA